ncbi:unnamed protein product [Oppiella nova]|uniref:SH3 domain-containing protein n=1 Tax=Oppiella nova TaxID=334625 RepID=A0A7R9LFV2_9ACAR|nr:unnamed protein product [Oppiella nova]CAG2162480.1 unnamed protein product [Oppiella nova]
MTNNEPIQPSKNTRELDSLLAKLENDNKLLAELDGKLKKVNNNYNAIQGLDDISAGGIGGGGGSGGGAQDHSVYQLSTSMPSLTTSYLFQTSSLTDTGAGSAAKHSSGAGMYAKPSNMSSAQNGKSTQQMVNHVLHDEDMDYEDMDLRELDLERLKHSLLDDNDLLIVNTRSTPSITAKDLDKLMAKLDQDNRILAELDRKLKHVTTSGLIDSSYIYPMSSSLPSLNTASHLMRSSLGLTDRNPSATALLGHSASGGLIGGSSLKASQAAQPSAALNLMSMTGLNGQLSAHQQHQQQMIQQFLHSSQTPFQQQMDELKLAEDIVDSIEIPNRGRCKVYIARYSYDPFKQSPNDNPEAELTLMAGDFVLIFGGVDEDGFFYGELMDGKRGLIPSNFVEKLTGEDLFEFQASVLYGNNRDSESDTASYPPEFYDAILNEQICHSNFQHLLAPDDFHRINDYIDLEDITEIDEDISDLERAEVEAAKNTGMSLG